MIPYAILCGKIYWKDQSDLEIRILDLSSEGFTFRVSHKYEVLENVKAFQLSFFQYALAEYISVSLDKFQIERISEEEFYSVFQVYTEDTAFISCAQTLMKEYVNYIDLKLAGNDTELSHVLTGYPKEEVFADSLQEWKEVLFSKAKEKFLDNEKNSNKNESLREFFSHFIPNVEFAIELDSDSLYQKFLTDDIQTFADDYWKQSGLDWHPFSEFPIQCVYIGSQYCMHLFPEATRLISLLNRCMELGMKPVVVFPPMKENDVEQYRNIFHQLYEWFLSQQNYLTLSSLEVVVNDWGMIDFLVQEPYQKVFSMTLGVLLNKRRKDVRMHYKTGASQQYLFLKENSLNSEFYADFLKDKYGIHRYSYESCGYLYDLPNGSHVLHLPFYQMNTSGHCVLYAACKNQDRGKQEYVLNCPKFCKDHAFIYPSALRMIGAKNSLFGFDERILWDMEYMKELCQNSVFRVVLSLL